MSDIRFEWNDAKAAGNRRKHGVCFEEARSVFYDEKALRIPDPDHSEREDRFVMLGMSQRMRVLLVVHVFREDDGVIRLISARRATKNDQQQYWVRLL
jgi:uncharacterized DUF497 family protein